MLDILLLKVTHAGKENAERVLPYLEGADVFSPEAAESLTSEAEKTEEDWKKAQLSHDFEGYLSGMDLDEHQVTINSRAFNEGASLYFLERISRPTWIKMKLMWRYCYNILLTKADKQLARGDIEAYLNTFYDREQKKQIYINTRDRKIARTIDNAEQEIKRKYDSLAGKERLKLVAPLGRRHSPERYTSFPVTVINIPSAEQNVYEELDAAIMQGRLLHPDMKQLILRIGAIKLAEQGKIPLDQKELQNMSYKHLEECIRTYCTTFTA